MLMILIGAKRGQLADAEEPLEVVPLPAAKLQGALVRIRSAEPTLPAATRRKTAQ